MQQIIDNINTFNVLVPRLYTYEKIELPEIQKYKYNGNRNINHKYNNKEYEIDYEEIREKLIYMYITNNRVRYKLNINNLTEIELAINKLPLSSNLNNVFYIKRYDNILNIISLTLLINNETDITNGFTNYEEKMNICIDQILSSYIILLNKTPYINKYKIKEIDILLSSEKHLYSELKSFSKYNAHVAGLGAMPNSKTTTEIKNNNNLLGALEENEKICIKLSEKAKNIL